jgi:peptidoglycan hydrolase CwlO-like protein
MNEIIWQAIVGLTFFLVLLSLFLHYILNADLGKETRKINDSIFEHDEIKQSILNLHEQLKKINKDLKHLNKKTNFLKKEVESFYSRIESLELQMMASQKNGTSKN